VKAISAELEAVLCIGKIELEIGLVIWKLGLRV